MKMNIPFQEAEECVKKVKDRDMGYLFENMEKMDIQEERRKTEEARKEAEKARNEMEKACNEAMKNIIRIYRKLGASKESAVQELMNSYALDRKTAWDKVGQYWKEESDEKKA